MRYSLTLGFAALAAMFGSCEGTPALDPSNPEDITFALTFIAPDTETACGPAAGIEVTIASGSEIETCQAMWTATIGEAWTSPGDDGHHQVADCFFVVQAGTWAIVSVDVLGTDGEPLDCCDAAYPATVEVEAAMTTELGIELQCALEGPGALDIYGWLERPPVIVDLTIGPSKFAEGCAPIVLDVVAIDREADTIVFGWDVIDGPSDDYVLTPDPANGAHATFYSGVAGTYMIEVTATDDPHGMSTALVFPVHVTSDDPTCSEIGEGDCTHTQGYWKNHAEAWPLDHVQLGAVLYTQAEALALFDLTSGGDVTILIAHQLIAAKLNVALGAHAPGLAGLIDFADQFLVTYPLGSGVTHGEPKEQGSAINDALTAFNEGELAGTWCSYSPR